MSDPHQPYLTIRSRGDRESLTSTDSAYASGNSDFAVPTATHDIGRVNYHVKHLDSFARTLEDSASRAFPNRGRTQQQRYKKVISLLMHWKSDDLFVLPELEDLEKCMREDYGFETDTFSIPSENAHLELMMRIGAMIKDHEATDTLFIVYYGGHARIDESRQSTWCATRNPNSPSLQWSAIQTLLERSMSDTLILLDCCAGAASATFPNGKSITETISASSWDAIAPDPGRYSFTNALIEVLQEWRLRVFSAAMVHAEVLARLKHPRPITINGKLFEARSTPVHFMMTSNHRAPSIEIGRTLPPARQLPSPPADPDYGAYAHGQYAPSHYGPGHGGHGQFAPLPAGITAGPSGGRGPLGEPVSDPNEDEPHVMISLALEEDQNLDINAWQEWLASFPALAKYVKVQGVFKSHSTLLLLSVPVMVWDLLPENHACSFIAFIRSNNLIKESKPTAPETVTTTREIPVDNDVAAEVPVRDDTDGARDNATEVDAVSDYDTHSIHDIEFDDDGVSLISGTTFSPTEGQVPSIRMSIASTAVPSISDAASIRHPMPPRTQHTLSHAQSQRAYHHNSLVDDTISSSSSAIARRPGLGSQSIRTQNVLGYPPDVGSSRFFKSGASLSRAMIMNQQKTARRANFEGNPNEGPRLAQHITDRLEQYFREHPNPSVGIAEFFASNLGVEKRDIDQWFHRRRQQEKTTQNLQSLTMVDQPAIENGDGPGAKMILPGQLNRLLDIFPPSSLLFVDLRRPTDFDKSHIYGAINLRMPVSFIEEGFDLIDKAFTDDQSRRNFARAASCRCIIFYDRVLEFPWECPMADALTKKLHEKKGWAGEYYVLKGHYREFSASFDKYITGDRMSQAAKNYVDSLRQRTPPTQTEMSGIDQNYAEWKEHVDQQNWMALADLPANLEERQQAVNQHQAELEAELESRNPVLFSKAMGLRMPTLQTNKSATAMYEMVKAGSGGSHPEKYSALEKELRTDLVGPLHRGLEKMHHGETTAVSGGGGDGGGGASYPPGYDKFADFGETSSVPSVSDDYDDAEGRDEFLRDEAAYLKAAGENGGGMGAMGMGRGGSPNMMNDPRRAREKSFWKRLRVNK
ncbi:tyrosine-protein phosphatase non-receptor type 6 [Ophiostoma piceae UAMH 11346]|uniref:Tyrosine-protein phosphatase non-receptor type 6 n=1 Tax=Ophiostoma piceae (strain UAMH 11346) TaxID=1262450 RepID=S3C7M2_OPHP1|nr:tyrosine-protein phosphatase non-receptor type 6 [Ophiostoma piceae UAMH 11346]